MSMMPMILQTLVSANPSVNFKDQGFFDFNLNLDVMDVAGIPPFPDCLPDMVSAA